MQVKGLGEQPHYVDIAEDRTYRRLITSSHEDAVAAGIVALNGASVVPGMEVLFTQLLHPRFDRIRAVRSIAAPDTRRHRGDAMFRTMLKAAGRPFQQPRDGRPATVYAWIEGEQFLFPPPVGTRRHYLVLEMADLDVLPELFGVGTVEFKAGSEFAFLNRMLAFLAVLRARTGHPTLERYTTVVRAVSWFVGRWGRDAGGVICEVTGDVGGRVRREAVAVVRSDEGARIPIVLAGIAVSEVLAGRLVQPGVADLRTWVTEERLLTGLRERGLTMWRRTDAEHWRPYE